MEQKMPHADSRHESATASPAEPVTRLIGVIFVVVLGFCVICGYVLFDMRHSTGQRAAEVAASLAAAIENDVVRNVETLDLSLQGAIDNLKHPEIDRIAPDLRQLVLFDRAATAQHLGTILVTDEIGNVRFDSRTMNPPPLNLADRDYFLAHKNDPTLGMYIGRPEIGRTTAQRFIGLSRRLSSSDGSFSGVVLASLRLSYFQQLFKNSALGPNGNITLANIDSTVLMRWPYKQDLIGLNRSKATLYKYLALSRVGRYEAVSRTDGHRRLVVYRQIADLPLVLSVGQSTEYIYANWSQAAIAIGALAAALCAIALWLTVYLIRELKRRKKAETKYVTLALSDSLTGLGNRRHFNDVLDREWRRCMRDDEPIALMMLDTDLFKSYNDTYGHPAGDALLQTIGSAIAGTIKRGSDFGARYGGDEFAIVLSGASTAEAERIAERLRLRFSEFCEQNSVVESGLSIGISGFRPRFDEHSSELLRAADHALYRAKNLGRNRTEVLSVNLIDLAPALLRSNLYHAA